MRVAIFPARGNSQRIKGKNIKPFFGKPMLLYPLEVAQQSGLFDLIVVSTDDPKIAKIAFHAGATVVPRDKDDGTMGTQELAARVLEQLGLHGDMACVIYPASPLLDVEHLALGLRGLVNVDAPNFCMAVDFEGKDAGCFYWGWVKAFRERLPLENKKTTAEVVMPKGRAIDINTPKDLAEAKRMFQKLKKQEKHEIIEAV